jgi:IS5 family transposase
MKQASLKLNLSVNKTRKQVFLEEMEQVVPRATLVELIAPYYPEGKTGRPPFFLGVVAWRHNADLLGSSAGSVALVLTGQAKPR